MKSLNRLILLTFQDWGHSSAGRALAWHARGQGSNPLGSIN